MKSTSSRLKLAIGKVGVLVFQLTFFAAVLLFTAGRCTHDAKGFLSCIGVTKEPPQLTLRQLDEKNPQDVRLATALAKAARAGGLSLEKLRVGIVVSQTVNAANIGPDAFLLFEGLSKLSDEALDAVAAHEVAHAVKGHSKNSAEIADKLQRATSIIGTLLNEDDGAQEEVASWISSVALAPHSKSQELEADKFAIELLEKSGYGARSADVMCSALSALAADGDSGGGFLSTHPSIPERIAAIRLH